LSLSVTFQLSILLQTKTSAPLSEVFGLSCKYQAWLQSLTKDKLVSLFVESIIDAEKSFIRLIFFITDALEKRRRLVSECDFSALYTTSNYDWCSTQLGIWPRLQIPDLVAKSHQGQTC
jgi:hypothetical protein